MTILNTIFPLFALLFLGSLLKQMKITNETFLNTSDKLVYYIFFPVMLFWKIGSTSPQNGISIGLCFAAIISVMIVFILSLIAIKLFNITHFQAGSFVQASFRFNTYIGMAIVINTLGESGVRHFGILVGFIIPIINVLAVSTLIWHSGIKLEKKEKVLFLIKALISNPLIIGCILGILFSRLNLRFPIFLTNTFSLMTAVTLPLALLSIGGSLSFTGIKNNTWISLLAAVLKLFVLPVIGYGFLTLFHTTGIPFKTGMIFFTLPTSTALFVLSSQLNSDTDLASSSIMLSTLFSFFSLSIALLI
ncbi:MAG: AEC family transporter [Desulfobacteraceae bacterium]|nr:AEC family transporter [Desulfobacteraceae bacterium]